MTTDHNEAMNQLPHKLATLIKCLPQAPFRDHLAAECIKQAERIAELEAERDTLRAEVERLRAREKACSTVNEGECIALVRMGQELAEAMGLNPLTASPADIVAAARKATP